jgi:hypothetical protein
MVKGTLLRVSIRVDDVGQEAGVLENDLAGFLQGQASLRGRTHVVAERSRPGAMNQSVATVIVELGPTALTAFASGLVTWIRHRTANAKVTVRRPDGARWELSAQRVKGLGAEQVTELVKQLSAALSDEPPKE